MRTRTRGLQTLVPEYPYHRLRAFSSQSSLEAGDAPIGRALLAHVDDVQGLAVRYDGTWHEGDADITRDLT